MHITQKPWGKEIVWTRTEWYMSKLLVISKGEQLSLQVHKYKEESMLVLSGKVKIQLDDHESISSSGDFFDIYHGTKHRVTALEDSVILEVSTPDIGDTTRLEDKYGRYSDGV